MSALSFTAAVAARPALVGDKTRASSRVNKETRAIGGFGPNIPADEYKKKMEAKKKLIEENKKKAAAKKPARSATRDEDEGRPPRGRYSRTVADGATTKRPPSSTRS